MRSGSKQLFRKQRVARMRKLKLCGGGSTDDQQLDNKLTGVLFNETYSWNCDLEDGWRSGVHIERGENPFKSSERAESERDQRLFDEDSGSKLWNVSPRS